MPVDEDVDRAAVRSHRRSAGPSTAPTDPHTTDKLTPVRPAAVPGGLVEVE